MATTHTTAARNTIADTVTALVDANGIGKLVIMTSGDVEVATLTMSATAFGAAASGTCNANAITDDTNATGGTAALYKITDGADTEIFRGSVTATGGGGDLQLSSVNIGAGDTVSISSFSYTAPA